MRPAHILSVSRGLGEGFRFAGFVLLHFSETMPILGSLSSQS